MLPAAMNRRVALSLATIVMAMSAFILVIDAAVMMEGLDKYERLETRHLAALIAGRYDEADRIVIEQMEVLCKHSSLLKRTPRECAPQ